MLRIEEGRRRHQHRRQPDEAVECRDELRHRRHGDPLRGDPADRAADRDRDRDLDRIGDLVRHQRRADRQRHAEHAEPVAPAAARGRGKPAQREDEACARDQIGQRRQGFTSCIPSALLLLVHRQHPLGDREAAEDIDAGERHRDQPQPFRDLRSGGKAGDQRARPRSPTRSRWSPPSAACATPA